MPNQVRKRRQFENAPSFRATGRGYFNALPNFPANAKNSNLLLHNRGLNDGARNHKLWIFCTGISTGWTVSGSYGQSAAARTFYPNNLTQDEITYSGVVANQYEYDRIVEFVLQHHKRALDTFDQDADPNSPGQSTAPLEVSLFPYLIDTGKRTKKGEIVYREVYGGLPGSGFNGSGGAKVQGYITTIQAGHDRFVNAKTFDLTLRVSYDFLSKPVHLRGELNKNLRHDYMQSFGQNYKSPPVPLPGSGFEGEKSIWDQAAAQGVSTNDLIETHK